jgi:hypothetical protein
MHGTLRRSGGRSAMTHPSHSFVDHYCLHCGTMDIALDGIPEASCANAPAPQRTPQGHQFADISGRCSRCGAHCMSIDAKLRCVPDDVESGVTEEF